nr:tetratricopeptide repeat protein [bacterium]
MLRRSHLTITFILLLISAIWINEFVLASDDVHKIPEPEKFTEMKLTEELNLSGETLRELVGANPRLSGLREITARVYELLDFECDSQKVESIFQFYRDSLETQGWHVMLRKIDKHKATLNLVLQEDDKREGLFIVQLIPTELTLIKLMGKFSLGALDELRSALRAEWQLDTLRPLPTREKPLIREPFSPSKIADYIPRSINVEHLEQAIKEGQTYPDIHTYLGIAYEHHSNFAKAQEQYQIVLDQFPDASDWILTRVLYGMGKCSEQLGEIEKAGQNYNKFIDEFGLGSYFSPAVESGLIRLQQHGEAVLSKENEIAKGWLAMADEQLYNRWAYEDAIETYDSIIRLSPASPYAASAQFMKGI